MLDNCSIHSVQVLTAFAEQYRCAVLFTAPYWPELNPIEHAWGHLKRTLQGRQQAYLEGPYEEIARSLVDVGRFAAATIRGCGY